MDGFFPALMVSLFLVFESCVTTPCFAHFRADVWALMVVEASICRGEAPINDHRLLVAALTPIGGGGVQVSQPI